MMSLVGRLEWAGERAASSNSKHLQQATSKQVSSVFDLGIDRGISRAVSHTRTLAQRCCITAADAASSSSPIVVAAAGGQTN